MPAALPPSLTLAVTLHGSITLLVIGALGVLSVAMSQVTRRWLPISEVVAFLVIGIMLGPQLFGVIERQTIRTVEPLTALALGAIVFVTGERLRLRELRRMRRTLLPISLLGSAFAFGACLAGLLAVGVSTPTAYLLAAIAPSTAPVTVQAIVAERRAAGTFTDHVLAATALNTLAAALLFGVGAPFVFADVASGNAQREALQSFVQLLVVSVGVGLVGGAAIRVARRHVAERWGDRVLLVWVALLLIVGAVEALDSSVVIATLVAGAVVANDRTHPHEVFDAIRVLEAPIFLVFFIVTGADVHVRQFIALGKAGAVYFAARWLGRVAGSWLGATASPARGWGWGHRIGTAQLPYAGMAVGLASYTVGRAAAVGAPDVGTDVAALVLGTVFLFEILTPLLLDRALVYTGESAGGGSAASRYATER